MPRECTITECVQPMYARTWCKTHYQRWYRYGTPDVPSRNDRGLSVAERIAKHTKMMPHGCLEWTGGVDKGGYGTLYYQNRPWRASRLVYVTEVGPLTDQQVVRHSCDNPPCVLTAHLLAGSVRDNFQDMVDRGLPFAGVSGALASGAKKRAATTCLRGHPFDEENTYWARGSRNCRACRRECIRQWEAANRTPRPPETRTARTRK